MWRDNTLIYNLEIENAENLPGFTNSEDNEVAGDSFNERNSKLINTTDNFFISNIKHRLLAPSHKGTIDTHSFGQDPTYARNDEATDSHSSTTITFTDDSAGQIADLHYKLGQQ